MLAAAIPASGGLVLSAPVISVVDNDASVRAATENFLKSRGYIAQIFASAKHRGARSRLERFEKPYG
ncbi:FixJ family two-component response regulator [Bradyrhizobium sp. CIR48]|nr:FixJ family two-component response regulator [Bradyrhizobium sp. CIR48]